MTDVNDVLKKYEADIADGGLQLMRYEDSTVAFPFELKPRVWFYRSDIFEEAGIDADEIKTTDDFIAAGRKLQDKVPWKIHLQCRFLRSRLLILHGFERKWCKVYG